ncbi:MAG TPA: GNAT family N-acetyltransferase [Phototrophicaceae bacterium]|nr:GNAT family N-acetyltransferase [Phototrophicaceae bacterium]
MEYRALNTVAEFDEALNLEIAVWGLDPRDAVPTSLLHAIQHGGGLVMGAYDGQRLVGIALAFPARSNDRLILWSHMTGVDRAYQGRSVGYELKQSQRQWALANGFEEMRWTFDPLQRGNANFNLHRLGATLAPEYHVNFYGIMKDEINHADVPSDRVEAIWNLREPREPIDVSPNLPFLLADRGEPVMISLNETQPAYLAQIPSHIQPGDLLRWRLALREALTTAFACGYRAVDFTSTNAYLLRRS